MSKLIEAVEALKYPTQHPFQRPILHSLVNSQMDKVIALIREHEAQARWHEPTCPYVVTDKEGSSYCRLAEQNGAPQRDKREACLSRNEVKSACLSESGENERQEASKQEAALGSAAMIEAWKKCKDQGQIAEGQQEAFFLGWVQATGAVYGA